MSPAHLRYTWARFTPARTTLDLRLDALQERAQRCQRHERKFKTWRGSFRKRLAALLPALVLAACSAPQQGAGSERAFICEADGELTEQHVGVRSAWTREDYSGVWRILYTDGATATYLQARGETCYTETTN